MKINCTIFILILSLWLCSITWAGGCQTGFSSPGTCFVTSDGTTPSCSVTDVQAAVNAASDGDIVVLPACAETTWNSYLTITKGITLKGAGIGQTIITGDAYGGYNGIIKVIPAANDTLRITGFTFDGDSKSPSGIYLFNNSTTIMNKIRVDHNKIINTTSNAMRVYGPVYGVIDNNIFTASSRVHGIDFSGIGYRAWDLTTQEYGTANNLYIEDNTITGNVTYASNGSGGRYAFRYNTFVNSLATLLAPFDAHGNQGVTYNNVGTMVTEIYGNKFDANSESVWFFAHRGGWALVFNNLVENVVGSINIGFREEYADDLHGDVYNMHVSNSYYWTNLKNNTSQIPYDATYLSNNNCCVNSAAWQASHDYGSNYCAHITGDPNGNCWRTIDNWTPGTTGPSGVTEPNWAGSPNKMDVIIDGQVTWLNMGAGTPIAENTDFFIQKTGAFNGTGVTGGGVDCGTLAARPATCTVGVGYWATDQSCSDLKGMVGANPSTPITGTLYKCTAPNTWTAYYKPYTYPHPLREEGTVSPPEAPKSLMVVD